MTEADWTRDFSFADLENASNWVRELSRIIPRVEIKIYSLWFADRYGRLLFRITDPKSDDLLCAASDPKLWIEECFRKLQPMIREVAENLKPRQAGCPSGRGQFLLPVVAQDRLACVAGGCFISQSREAELNALGNFKKQLSKLNASFDGDVIRIDTVNTSIRILQSLFSAVEPRRDDAGSQDATRGLSMVWDVSKLVASSQDFEVVLKAVARIVTNRLDMDSCSIYIFDKNSRSLLLKAIHGIAQKEIRRTKIKLGEGITGWAAQRREIMSVPDVSVHPGYLPGFVKDDVKRFPSLLSVPMVVKNELIGIINVRTKTVHEFTETERSLVSAIAGQVAVGLKNAELRTQLAELAFDFPSDALLKYDGESMKLTTLEAISQLVSTSLELDRTLETVVNVVSHALGIDVCSIYLLDDQDGRLVLRATKGLDQAAIGKVRMRIGEGITGWTAQRQKPILLSNASSHPKFKHFDLTRETRYNSMLSVPLIDQGRVLGVINVQDTTNREFTQDELKMLTTIGSQVAAGLRNAKLYSDITKKLTEMSALIEVGKVITSTLDLDELLNSVAKICARIMEARGAIIRLLNEETGELDVQAAFGFGRDALKSDSVAIGQGIAGWVAQHREPTLVDNVTADPRFARSLKVIVKNMIAVPLIAQDKVIGVLSVYDKLPDGDTPRGFIEDDMRLLTIMADEAAMAIENARLFDSVERAERQLRETQEQLIRSEKLAALGDMLAGVAHEVRNPLVSIGGFARLMASEVDAGSAHKKYLDLMIREVTRLEKMVNDILFFARSHKKRAEPVNLREVIDRTLLMLQDRLQSQDIELTTRLDRSTPMVTGDVDSLLQSVLNVIQNSVEAMPRGGKLAVALQPVDEDFVEVRVEDTGPGMSQEQMKSILHPFTTTKTTGVGLGLSITNKIIEDQGGRLEFNSELGKGTVCSIKLPAIKNR